MSLQLERLTKINNNLYIDEKLRKDLDIDSLQNQDIFSTKWSMLEESSEQDQDEGWKSFQLDWFLELYGYASTSAFQDYINSLSKAPSLLDAGCGKGYKAAWLSQITKQASILGIDFSSSVYNASNRYSPSEFNLKFVQADIACMPINDSSQDLVLCDQVLHHTKDPSKTLREFFRVLKPGGKLLTYVYRKKAVPREIIDDYFRNAVHDFSDDQLWEIAEGMTKIGKILSSNDIELDFPDIKALNIKGGKQSLQRFLYWNFFKCFWNSDFGYEASLSTNYDWYSPSIAYRYTKEEFLDLTKNAGFTVEYLHEEEACFSGRFIRSNR